MAKKEYIKNKKGIIVYPVTLEQAVIDGNGVSLDVKLETMTGGMDILELSSSSGILTEEQVTLVQSDHCIVKYDGFYYYKKVQGETTCTYNRVSEEKSERNTTDYYFTCTYSSGVFTFGSTVTPQGSPDAVKYVEQELTSEQKVQARSNIGAGTYSKPVGGIPASDLASDATPEQIQSDWNQTDTGARDYIKNKPNIPSQVSDVIKYTPQTLTSAEQEQARANIGAGTYSKPSGGIPASDLASGVVPDVIGIDFVSSNQDGTVVFTLTNGDTVTIDLNHDHTAYYAKANATSQPAGGFEPDVVYNLGTLTGTIVFSLAAPITGNINHYFWSFTSGQVAPTVTWPSNIIWAAGEEPIVQPEAYYEVSILNGVAQYLEVYML